jgi:Asp-tRNA(Asn)/Glu-tRNA(Gln) amidotransferase C subunit
MKRHLKRLRKLKRNTHTDKLSSQKKQTSIISDLRNATQEVSTNPGWYVLISVVGIAIVTIVIFAVLWSRPELVEDATRGTTTVVLPAPHSESRPKDNDKRADDLVDKIDKLITTFRQEALNDTEKGPKKFKELLSKVVTHLKELDGINKQKSEIAQNSFYALFPDFLANQGNLVIQSQIAHNEAYIKMYKSLHTKVTNAILSMSQDNPMNVVHLFVDIVKDLELTHTLQERSQAYVGFDSKIQAWATLKKILDNSSVIGLNEDKNEWVKKQMENFHDGDRDNAKDFVEALWASKHALRVRENEIFASLTTALFNMEKCFKEGKDGPSIPVLRQNFGVLFQHLQLTEEQTKILSNQLFGVKAWNDTVSGANTSLIDTITAAKQTNDELRKANEILKRQLDDIRKNDELLKLVKNATKKNLADDLSATRDFMDEFRKIMDFSQLDVSGDAEMTGDSEPVMEVVKDAVTVQHWIDKLHKAESEIKILKSGLSAKLGEVLTNFVQQQTGQKTEDEVKEIIRLAQTFLSTDDMLELINAKGGLKKVSHGVWKQRKDAADALQKTFKKIQKFSPGQMIVDGEKAPGKTEIKDILKELVQHQWALFHGDGIEQDVLQGLQQALENGIDGVDLKQVSSDLFTSKFCEVLANVRVCNHLPTLETCIDTGEHNLLENSPRLYLLQFVSHKIMSFVNLFAVIPNGALEEYTIPKTPKKLLNLNLKLLGACIFEQEHLGKIKTHVEKLAKKIHFYNETNSGQFGKLVGFFRFTHEAIKYLDQNNEVVNGFIEFLKKPENNPQLGNTVFRYLIRLLIHPLQVKGVVTRQSLERIMNYVLFTVHNYVVGFEQTDGALVTTQFALCHILWKCYRIIKGEKFRDNNDVVEPILQSDYLYFDKGEGNDMCHLYHAFTKVNQQQSDTNHSQKMLAKIKELSESEEYTQNATQTLDDAVAQYHKFVETECAVWDVQIKNMCAVQQYPSQDNLPSTPPAVPDVDSYGKLPHVSAHFSKFVQEYRAKIEQHHSIFVRFPWLRLETNQLETDDKAKKKAIDNVLKIFKNHFVTNPGRSVGPYPRHLPQINEESYRTDYIKRKIKTAETRPVVSAVLDCCKSLDGLDKAIDQMLEGLDGREPHMTRLLLFDICHKCTMICLPGSAKLEAYAHGTKYKEIASKVADFYHECQDDFATLQMDEWVTNIARKKSVKHQFIDIKYADETLQKLLEDGGGYLQSIDHMLIALFFADCIDTTTYDSFNVTLRYFIRESCPFSTCFDLMKTRIQDHVDDPYEDGKAYEAYVKFIGEICDYFGLFVEAG